MGLSTARESAIAWGIAIGILLLLVLVIETVLAATTARSPGIGVSREDVQAFFEQELFGFTVRSVDTVGGHQGVSLMAPAQGIGELHLFGPKRKLTRASITVGLSRDNKAVTARSAMYLNGFLMTVAPDWNKGPTWVKDNLARALSSGSVVTYLTNPDRTVSMRIESQMGFVMLSIQAGA